MIVERKKANVYYCGNVRFVPGNNVLTKEEVDQIQNDSNLKAAFDEQIDRGVMEIKSKRIRATEYPFEKMTVSKMRSVINDLYDVGMLRQIQERDERDTIQKAVAKQLKVIKAAGVKKPEEEDGND